MAAAVPLNTTEIRHLGWALTDERIRLVMNTGLTDVAGPRIHTQQLVGLPLIHVETPRFSTGQQLTKRAVDLLLSGVGVIVISPLLLILALVVKLSSPGPVLFRQTRIG